MASINTVDKPEISLTYPIVNVTVGSEPQTIQIPLKRSQFVLGYDISVNLGNISGTTTATSWAVSLENPFISQIEVTADSTTMFKADTYMSEVYQGLFTGGFSDGSSFRADLADVDLRTGKEIQVTGMPSYQFTDVQMSLTIPSIQTLTGATSSSASGTAQIYISERDISRSLVDFKPIRHRTLETSTSLSVTGENDLPSFLSQSNIYKAVMLFASTEQNFTSGSNSAISKVELELNDTLKIVDSYYANLQQKAKAIFKQSMPAGILPIVWMPNADISQALNITNTQAIKSVNMKLDATTSPVYIKMLQSVYS